MAGTPRFKVYHGEEYIAACKYPEDAARLVAGPSGIGMTIRDGHKKIVWAEGHEDQCAAESFDYVAAVIQQRTGGRLSQGRVAASMRDHTIS